MPGDFALPSKFLQHPRCFRLVLVCHDPLRNQMWHRCDLDDIELDSVLHNGTHELR